MEQSRIYKYKLDFYYKSLIVYMLFLIVYVTLNDVVLSKQFKELYHDPIIYISLLFIVFFLVLLIVATISAKEMIFENDRIIIKNRFGKREIIFEDILSIRFSRERKMRIDNRSNIGRVRLRLKNRQRDLRIRLSVFWDEKKLISEFRNLAKSVVSRHNV